MKVSRRDLLKAGALGGTGVLLGDQGRRLLELSHAYAAGPAAAGVYPLADPENVLYGLCLQCHTECTLKVKIQDGILTKIDGNPYSPGQLQPQLDYKTGLDTAAKVDASICSKGQSGVQTLYDPYRLRKVLKRAGPRGSGKWTSIPFEQAIDEIVNGGQIFSGVGEKRVVEGLKDILVLKDAALSQALARDIGRLRAGELTVEAFQSAHRDHLDALIDPDHPDLGLKNNQFVFAAGRIEHGRAEFAKRFVNGAAGSVNWYAHTTICEQGHHIAYKYATARWTGSSFKTGKDHMKPDLEAAEFIIFWGTGYAEANFGPPPMTPQVTKSLVERGMKVAVIDPRLSKSAAHGWWVPVTPGGDLALALGMMRWIIDHGRIDRRFLGAANKAAAQAVGESSWSNAAWLVDTGTGKLLRASQLGVGGEGEFVAMVDGSPTAVDPYDANHAVTGDIEAAGTANGVAYRTSFLMLKDAAFEHDLPFYSQESGVPVATIEALAQEFTSHGKRAAIDLYRGPIKFTYGYYTAQAIIALNTLIGNIDWKGGLVVGGGHFNATGGGSAQPFDLGKMHPGALKATGIKNTRESSGPYETSTLFQRDGYPAKRPWFPFTGDVYQEIIPAAAAGYPYPVKALWLHKGTPALAAPAGHLQIDMLRDTSKIPLFIADDIVIGETSMYADYVFPDVSYLEQWAWEGYSPAIKVKTLKLRQPVAAPIPEVVSVDGHDMPIGMESVMIALAKKLGLPGYGKDGFGAGVPFDRPEDYYLKTVANTAYDGTPVPEADAGELELFVKARRHLPPAVFDEAAWKRAVGDGVWARTVFVLNRGGRFDEPWLDAYDGDKVRHRLNGLMNLYVEPIGTAIQSVSGKRLTGVPVFQRMQHLDGREVDDGSGYPLKLFTYKEIFGGQSRTAGNYAGQGALLPENFVNLNPVTARQLGLENDDLVRLEGPTFKGAFEVGPGTDVSVQGRIRTVEGIAPGAVGISWHYGHWAYGSTDVVVNGQTVPGDKTRGRGLVPNPAVRVDDYLKDVCLTDPIAGDAVFNGTTVKLTKLASGRRTTHPGYLSEGPRRNQPPMRDPVFAAWLRREGLRLARGESDGSELRERTARDLKRG